MKKLFLLLAAVGLMFTACTEGDGFEENNNYLTFSDDTNTNPVVVAGGGMVNITFTTEYDWLITTNSEWLTTSKTSGIGGTIEFFITAAPNKSDKERTDIITIALSNEKTYNITVTQEPNEGIKHLVCQANEILYTTKFNYVIEKDFAGITGFGDTDATYCVDYGYDGTYGYIRFNNDVTKIPDNAFSGCASVEAIYLPDGVKEIGESAFTGCSALRYIVSDKSTDDFRSLIIDGCLCAIAPADVTSYTIPDSVTSLGGGVFKDFKGLKNISIPGSVKTIGSSAFAGCENLEKITIKNPGADVTNAFQDNKITSVELLYNNIETIDANTTHASFKKAPLLTILIDNTCKNIGNNAFDGYGNLTTITIPNSIKTIGNAAFKNCSSLSNIDIPDSVTSIGEYAFYQCSNLTQISIPSKISSIEDFTFYCCSKLSDVDINAGVKTIGVSAFHGCTSLMRIYIPEGVETIEKKAFYNCEVPSFFLPSTIKAIGEEVFCNYDDSIEIYIEAITPPAVYFRYDTSSYNDKRICFYVWNPDHSVDIYVPREALNAYQSYSHDDRQYGIHPSNWGCYSVKPHNF